MAIVVAHWPTLIFCAGALGLLMIFGAGNGPDAHA